MGIGANGERAFQSRAAKNDIFIFCFNLLLQNEEIASDELGSKASFICCLSSGTSVVQCRTQGKLSLSLKT